MLIAFFPSNIQINPKISMQDRVIIVKTVIITYKYNECHTNFLMFYVLYAEYCEVLLKFLVNSDMYKCIVS